MIKLASIKENLLYLGVFLCLMPLFKPFSFNISYGDIVYILLFLLILLQKKIKVNIFNDEKISVFYFLSIFLFFFGLTISSLLDGGAESFFTIFAQYFLLLFILPLIFINIPIDTKRLLKTYIYSITFIVLFGIYVYFFTSTIDYSIGGRMGSLFKNPNTLAKTIALSIPLILFYHYRYKSNIVLLSLLILLIGLMLASSFGGLISAILSLLLFFIFLGRFIGLLKILIGICISVIIYTTFFNLPEIFTERIIPIISSGDINEAGSYSNKISLMGDAWKAISENPIIGTGAGKYAEENIHNIVVHNSYLLIWVEGGIFSLLGFLGILLSFVILSFRFKNDKIFFATSLSILFVMIFNFLTNVHFYNRYTFIALYCIVFGTIYSERKKIIE